MALPHLPSIALRHDSPPLLRSQDRLPPASSDKPETFPLADCKDSTEDRHDSDKKELWSYRDTSLLLELYEEIFVMLGRGMIRKSDWSKISEQLTQQSGFAKSAEQCKNRIEYLRKHYRKEKARFIRSKIASHWTFYKKLEALVEDHHLRQFESCIKPLQIAIISDGTSFDARDRSDGRPLERLKPLLAAKSGDGVDFDARSDCRHSNPDPILMQKDFPSPANPNLRPGDALDEEEMVVAGATRAQVAASMPETSYKHSRKRRKVGASLGKDLKEGLSEFASVIERIERTKMEMVLMLERQRVEQEQKRAELEMERTKMLLQSQLEVAKLFCRNRARGSGRENE